MKLGTYPSLDQLQTLITAQPNGNMVPVYKEMLSDTLTPTSAYLRLVDHVKKNKKDSADKLEGYSFLFESVSSNEKIGRYSLLGADPYKILKSGKGYEIEGDPLLTIENYLDQVNFIKVDGLPEFTGGAIGYLSFDCVQYFEPKTRQELKDPLDIPESVHMFCDTVIVIDHLYQVLKVVTHLRGDLKDTAHLKNQYDLAVSKIDSLMVMLTHDAPTPLPTQPDIILSEEKVEFKSNVGQKGYEGFVDELKGNIRKGEIIQAVPSQRLARPTQLHPFNVYRYLRTVNPAPYLFYLDCDEFQAVGASPEMLVKVDTSRTVYTHPIAGTRRRGVDSAEDEELEKDLLSDIKETSEHVMLVDLGRNDVNRVCQPDTVTVDSLMHIERYSHVMHIVSNVSGTLRDDQTRFDAFRSIFPAGTVSGAPKVRAIQLVQGLEGEKRGIYAGSVGHFDYSGGLDTCIAIRTMVFKHGVAYLQAGGGIVSDSVPLDEYHETINKLSSNIATLEKAESYYANMNNH